MKKIFFLLLSLFLATSCGIDYVGEKRFVFESHVTDYNNNPISGKLIEVNINDGNETETIARDVTDANGNVQIVFPVPSNAKIAIAYVRDTQTQEKVIDEISGVDFPGYKLRMPQVKVYRNNEITNLNIQFNQTGEQTQLVGDVTLDGLQADELVHYHQIPNAAPEYLLSFGFRVVKNQTVILHYSVVDYSSSPPLVTDYNEPVAIGNEPVTYVLNY
jgi:hypothetical protein